VLNYLFVFDPTFKRQQEQQQRRNALINGGAGERLLPTLRRLAGEVGGVVRIPTFGIIIVQASRGGIYASFLKRGQPD
jgi:hypothetical protein